MKKILTALAFAFFACVASAQTYTVNNLAANNVKATKTQDAAGVAVEVVKDGAPLNYSDTRAAYVLQQRDTLNGGTNALIPGAVFQFNSTGNGTVTAASELSQTIWQGLFSFQKKTGDGSAHTFTSIGELGAYGPGGYNELGLFQGQGTNTGSLLGTISGVEMLIGDSPNGGVSSFPTKMQAVVGRIAKYNTTARPSYNFYASSEGTQAPNGILGINTGGLKSWARGFDFNGAVFTSGQFGLAPNNTSLAWMDTVGVAKPVLGVSNVNTTFLRAASDAAFLDLQTQTGATQIRVTPSGRVLIGTTTDDGVNGLQVTGPARITGALLATTTGTMPMFNDSGAAINAPHMVTGASILAAGASTVTFSAAAAFTSASSYVCTANDANGVNAVKVTNTSGTQMTLTGTGTNTVKFICAGN